MASGPTTSWQIEGGKVEAVTDFIFLGSKITTDGDWSHEIKRHLLLERKAMRNLDSILKSRDICLLTEVIPVKPMVTEQTLGDSEGPGSLVCCSPWVTNSQTWLRESTRTKNASDNYLEYLCKSTDTLLHKWNSIYFGWGSLDKF